MKSDEEIRQLIENNNRRAEESQKSLQAQFLVHFSNYPEEEKEITRLLNAAQKETETILLNSQRSIDGNVLKLENDRQKMFDKVENDRQQMFDKLEKDQQQMFGHLDIMATLKRKQLNNQAVNPSSTPSTLFTSPKPQMLPNNNAASKGLNITPSFLLKSLLGVGMALGVGLIIAGSMTGQLELSMAGGLIVGMLLSILLIMFVINKIIGPTKPSPVNEPMCNLGIY